ncbi:hypothetical protein [Exiguobacterium sp. SH0S2]|uniref:hypothetical protein n=1 Tax=Exiguobacterium sp. SH0S2 TaxID=2510950 RepID=UPI00103DC91B|nr:hypothetical protein [Exiguobacterium sp. SH0S2]TCI63172.1 hypothetical protein EVJ21_06570 [Exiguobacterium sp. SH0S2]
MEKKMNLINDKLSIVKVGYIFISQIMLICFLLLAYSPVFSNLFPPLSTEMYAFLMLLIVINVISLIFYTLFPIRINYELIRGEKLNLQKEKLILFFVLTGFLITFVYSKSIPIISIVLLNDSSYVYKEFGIPFFHVILLTFTQYYTINMWIRYLLNENKHLLKYIIILSSLPLVIYNRGSFLLLIVSMLVSYILIKKIKLKIIIKVFVGALIVSYLFGVSGNVRTNSLYKVEENPFKSSVIMNIGKPDAKISNSIDYIKPFYWSYFYIVSPLGNYQLALDGTIAHRHYFELMEKVNFNLYIIPDFISKRIVGDELYYSYMKIPLISPTITAATSFSLSYYADGWFGVCITVLAMYLLFFLSSMIKDPVNKLVAISLVSTIILFSFFSNMLIFSGLSFQLLYCFLFGSKYLKKYI